nr:MAG: RNA-dependent RNA polymerase [Sichuan forest noda-like virus 4]
MFAYAFESIVREILSEINRTTRYQLCVNSTRRFFRAVGDAVLSSGSLRPTCKQVVVVVSVVGSTAVISCFAMRWMRKYVDSPYANAEAYLLSRVMQRMIIDKTRKNIDISWFPMNSITNFRPTRLADNGHKVSGAVRDAARVAIHSAVIAAGLKICEVSPTKISDCEGAIHQHYAVGDLKRPVDMKVPNEKDVIVGVDVDYYINDLSKILGYGNATIFHSFNPTSVAGSDGDSNFRIMDGLVHYDVSGGGLWKHPVWNWCRFGEYMRVEAKNGGVVGWLLSWIGVKKHYYYKIMHSRPWKDCQHRVLVWLLPEASAWQFTWMACDLHAEEMKRVDYSDRKKPGWNRLVATVGNELRVSIGRNGEDAFVNMEKSTFDTLMGLTTPQSVASRMIQLDIKSPLVIALMSQYHGGKIGLDGLETPRLGRPIVPIVHWPVSSQCDEVQCSARAYSSPIVDMPNMMPQVRKYEALSQSLEERVTYVANGKLPSDKIRYLAEEFVKLVVPECGAGVPYELEETLSMLTKPSQKIMIDQVLETMDMDVRKLIEAFLKNEATNKAGRIISSFPDARFLVRFSAFTLKFRDEVLHNELNKKWFCPGLTPYEIAGKVRDYVGVVGTPIEGDFSNFDGTVSRWCQEHVMNAVYLRFFNGEYTRELKTFTDMLISCPARAKNFQFRYNAGTGVKSGSPTTCDLNTVLNAFMQYAAVRLTCPETEQWLAYNQIGLAFGDDSLFALEYSKQFERVAAELGMKLVVEKYDPLMGLTFLARVYPDPYTTSTSFQDPLRTLRKLHLTTRDPNIPLADAALDRVEGYLVTDQLSPVVGSYCKMVKRLTKDEDVEKRLSRKSVNKEKPYWVTGDGSWPQNPADLDLMFDVAAARLGINVAVLRTVDEQFKTLESLWFTPITLEEESPHKSTVDVKGEGVSVNMDNRLIENECKSTIERSSGVTGMQSKSASANNSGSDRSETPKQRRDTPRPRRTRRRIEQRGGKSGKGYNQPIVKTNDTGMVRNQQATGGRGDKEGVATAEGKAVGVAAGAGSSQTLK